PSGRNRQAARAHHHHAGDPAIGCTRRQEAAGHDRCESRRPVSDEQSAPEQQATDQQAPAEQAPAEQAPAEQAPDQQAPWGRVDDDGTVYVREATGERAVGQYPDATPEEALAYYERKFAELEGQVSLLEQRLRGGAPA